MISVFDMPQPVPADHAAKCCLAEAKQNTWEHRHLDAADCYARAECMLFCFRYDNLVRCSQQQQCSKSATGICPQQTMCLCPALEILENANASAHVLAFVRTQNVSLWCSS